MAMKKLSLQTGLPTEEFSSYFDFVELQPFQSNNYYGMEIIPHYTVHSIPTIGATFRLSTNDKTYSIGYGGDNKSRKDIQTMVREGITSPAKAEFLEKLYNEPHNLFFADGGLGILHGDPEDSLNSKSDRIIFLHLENLPAKFDAVFSMAEGGKRYNLIESRPDAFVIKTMEIMREHFPGIRDEWARTILSNVQITTYNSGDVILRQGEARRGGIYIILTGICGIMYHDGTTLSEIAYKEAGGIIGEMALLRNEPKRSASVVAKTPVTLCQIDEQVFYSLVKAENRIDDLLPMWTLRRRLEQHHPFCLFSDNVNDRIVRHAHLKTVEAKTLFYKANPSTHYAFILLEGRVALKSVDGYKTVLEAPGTCFGALGIPDTDERFDQTEYASLSPVTLLVIPAAQFARVVQNSPILRYHLYKMVKPHLGAAS